MFMFWLVDLTIAIDIRVDYGNRVTCCEINVRNTEMVIPLIFSLVFVWLIVQSWMNLKCLNQIRL